MEQNRTEYNGMEQSNFKKRRNTFSPRTGCRSWGTIVLSWEQMKRNGTEWNGMERNRAIFKK